MIKQIEMKKGKTCIHVIFSPTPQLTIGIFYLQALSREDLDVANLCYPTTGMCTVDLFQSVCLQHIFIYLALTDHKEMQTEMVGDVSCSSGLA